MSNPYLDALKSTSMATGADTPSNPYLNMLQEDEAARKARQAAQLSQAVKVNPEQYNTQRRVAQYLGYSVAAVETLPELADQAKVQQIQRDTASSPVLQRKYSEADFAKLAHDDSGTLAKLYDWSKGAGSQLLGSLHSGALSLVGVGATVIDALNPFTLSPSDAAVLFKDDPAKLRDVLQNSPATALSRVSRAMQEGSQAVAKDVNPQAQEAYGNLKYATLNPSEAAYLSPVKVTSDALQSLPTTLALAFSAYLTRGQSIKAYETAVAGGATAEAALATAVKTGSMTMARTSAASEGVVGAAQQFNQVEMETLQANLSKSPRYAELIAQGYSPEAAREVVAGSVATQAGQIAGIVDSVTNYVGGKYLGKIISEGGTLVPRVLKGAVQEGVTEFVQSMGEQFGQNWAEQMGIDPNTSLIKDVLESGIQGLVVGGLTGGGFAAAFGRVTRDQQQIAQSQADADRLQQALQTAGQSLLRERSPEQFRAVMAEMTDGNVYVDGQVLNQLAPEVLNQLPESVREKVATAAAIGDSVEIPVADVLTIAPGTPLEQVIVENARTDPFAMSKADAEAAAKMMQSDVVQNSQRIIQQAQDQEAARQKFETVRQGIEDQLNATGRFRKQVNYFKSFWLASFYNSYGTRSGMGIEEFSQKYFLRILGAPVGQQTGVLNAGGATLRTVNVGDTVDGRVVRDGVPNLESIGSSLDNYEVLPGVREVPISAFDAEYVSGISMDRLDERTRKLAEDIRASGEITPLIVVQDAQGMYVLEGGHRLDALIASGAQSLPAVVVIDQDNPPGQVLNAGMTLADVTAQWDSQGIRSSVSEKGGVITLSQIVVPEGQRSQGLGSQAMQALVDYADSTGQRIELGASSQLGGDKARLVEFYERFGFTRKPRSAPVNKPFKDTAMIREPRQVLEQSARASKAKPGADSPGAGVEEGNKLGFWPALRVKLTSKMKLPEKAPILTGTTNKNAAKQIAAIDNILAKFPKASESTAEWTKMMAYALGSDEVPIPPYAFIRDLNGTGSLEKLRTLTQGQIDDATHGFENAAEFRRAYSAGELGVETTGKLFMWSFLSRGVSPYTQEALFIDAFDGADKWIAMAARGEFTEAVFPEYEAWAKSVAPQGSGQPGAGATHNLNAFGQDFLFKMSRVGVDGKTHMQRLHDMMSDPNQTGKQIRREFATFGEGVGIDNKVVSFTLLVAGFPDVMVLDRVQIRQLWDDGRFNGVNLYDGVTETKLVSGKDGVTKEKPVKLAGSSLNNLAEGVRGILVYEAIERGLEGKIKQLYADLGRPQDASIGRYHWETWVADSQQEASHGTLGAILSDAKGDDQAIAKVAAKQGEYGAYEYGALYNRDADGVPWFGYEIPGGGPFAFSVPAFRAFLEDIKRPANGVVPTKFLVTNKRKTKDGKVTEIDEGYSNGPWYNRPGVDQERLAERARYWADRAGGSGEGQRALEEAVRQQAADGAGSAAEEGADGVLNQGLPVLSWGISSDDMMIAEIGNGWTAAIYMEEDGTAELTVLDPRGVDFGEPITYADVNQARTAAPAVIARRVSTKGVRPGATSVLEQGPRGTFNPQTLELVLNPNADLSTWFHETGHFFLEVLADVASQPDAPAQIAEDMNRVLAWFGIKGDETVGGADSGMPLEQGAFPTERQFYNNYAQHIDLRGRAAGIAEQNKVAILAEGFKKGANVNALPLSMGDPLNIVERKFSPRAGDVVYLAPKGTWKSRPNGMEIQDGWRPAPWEAITIGPDDVGKPMYELFKREWAKHNAASLAQDNQPAAPSTQPLPQRRTPLEVWNAMTLDQKRPYHERWAESIEQYVMEGKAPSVELQGVMRRFAAWLKSVYGSIKQFLAGRGVPVAGGQDLTQPAFHGTPARNIDKFSTDFIGTGEGAQAYGWGLYFASRREIADWYRKTLSDPNHRDGWTKTLDRAIRNSEQIVRDNNLRLVSDSRKRELEEDAGGELTREEATAWDHLLTESSVGQLYEVDIPEDSEMLLWDKPLSEQPEVVRNALEGAEIKNVSGQNILDLDPLGKEIYDALSNNLSNSERASKLLSEFGIKGIKYLDGGSRTAGDGTYNYVIFSGDDVQIRNQFYQADQPAGSDIQLNDDIRRVMDRMLATDEQIAQANEVAGLMPDEQADGEAAERLQKRSMADLKWQVKARDAAIAKLKREAKAIEKQVREEVTAEVDATPEMRAKKALDALQITPEYEGLVRQHAEERAAVERTERDRLVAELYAANPDVTGLKRGQLLAKNKREIANKVDAYMIAWDKSNPKPSRPMNINDADLATVADSFGFESVPAMLEAISVFGSRQEAIDGMTERRMLEEHGDLIDERAITEAANEAVHNEARARSLATELRTQREMLGARTDTGEVNARGARITVNALVEAAKQFGANVISRTPLKDLRSTAWKHTAAERRAGKRWAEATAAGKTEDAVQAKQDQMLNNAAAKAALDAAAESKKILEFFKRVTKGNDEKVVKKGRDPDIVNAARAVLAAYGIETPTTKGAQDYLDVLQRNDPDTYAVVQPMMAIAMQNAQPLEALTFEELQGLHESIRAMWHLAKRSRQMEVDGDMLDIDDVADELFARMEQIGIPDRVAGEGMAVTKEEERGLFLKQGIAFLRRVEQWAEGMDGKYGGPFLRFIFQPIKGAADRYRKDRIAYRKKFQALVDNLAPIVGDSVIAAPELNYTFGTPGSTAGTAMNEILHAIAHTGNDSNKRKLLLGRGWATENPDGTLDTRRWDQFIRRLVNEGKLQKEHFDFVQGVWDLLEETKPLAQKAHRDAFGRYFSEVTANEFVDPFGVTRRGGYVPAQVDSRLVKDNALRKLAEEQNNSMAYAFPQPAKGFTMARTEYNRPLMLDLRSLSQHLDKVLLFSHMTVPARDVRKLITRKNVSQPLDRIQPAAIESMLQPWLQRSAQQIVETPIVGSGKWARLPGIIRARAGAALMFANVSNAIQQITGLSTAMIKVGPGHMMRAMAQHVAHPVESARAVWALSTYMDDRAKNEVAVMNEQMQAILINPSVYEKVQDWSMRHAYFLQTAIDNALSPIIWTGAYNQALAEGMSDVDAVRFADGTVRQTQGSTLPEDVSRFETGPAYARAFTQFISYFNMVANTNGTALKQVASEVGLKKGAGRAFSVVMLGLLVPIWVAEAIALAFKGGPDDEDKDGVLIDDWLAAVFGFGTAKGLLAMIPILGQAANSAVTRLDNNPMNDRISLSPGVSLLESALGGNVQTVYELLSEDKEVNARRAVRDAATLVSVFTGVPVYAVARPAGYAAGVAQGKIEPTSEVDMARGLITGTASPESKVR